MKKVWISDYRRVLMAMWSEYPSDTREKQILFFDEWMQTPGAEFYKLEGSGGEYIGWFIMINNEFQGNSFRRHFSSYLGDEEVKKLISEATKGI